MLNVLRRNAMNAESDEFVAIRSFETFLAKAFDKFRRDAVNAKGDELIGIEILKILGFDPTGEIEADVQDGHGILLVFLHGKTQGPHLLGIIGVGREMENAGAFAVFQITLAVEASGIARDGELGILLARFGNVQALERGERPRGFMLRGTAVLMGD